MEINIGDYGRAKKSGYIGKIYNINEFRKPNMIYALDIPRADDYVFMGKDDFISSKDIINLIEVGDYVNGYKVMLVNKNCLMLSNGEIVREIKINDKIVTKEQYALMEYKVN